MNHSAFSGHNRYGPGHSARMRRWTILLIRFSRLEDLPTSSGLAAGRDATATAAQRVREPAKTRPWTSYHNAPERWVAILS